MGGGGREGGMRTGKVGESDEGEGGERERERERTRLLLSIAHQAHESFITNRKVPIPTPPHLLSLGK
jgi:hypothetical protein